MPRRKQKHRTEIGYYHLEITEWDWDYSLSVNVPPSEDTQFSEYRYLVIRGTLLRPRKIKPETAEINLFPQSLDIPRHQGETRPRSVGSLDFHGGRLVGYLAMALDVLGPVLQMLIAGRYKYLLMDGEPMRDRKAVIRHYYFAAKHDEADYPDDE